MLDKPQFSKCDTYRVLRKHPELVDKMTDKQRLILKNFIPAKWYDKIEKEHLQRKNLMQQYVQIAFESRWLEAKPENTPMCEWCQCRRADDVDHLEGRGWKHNFANRLLDPYNLMFVCRYCHTNKWWREWKLRAKEIVKWKIVCNND